MARPLKTIDEKRVIELAAKGLTLKEIAAFENISYATLNRRAASACEKGQDLLRGQLRAKQVQVALGEPGTKPNPIMLIWLGKQLLNQADKQEVDVRKELSVQMVVGINQQKLNRLTQGYFESKQLPEAIDASAQIWADEGMPKPEQQVGQHEIESMSKSSDSQSAKSDE